MTHVLPFRCALGPEGWELRRGIRGRVLAQGTGIRRAPHSGLRGSSGWCYGVVVLWVVGEATSARVFSRHIELKQSAGFSIKETAGLGTICWRKPLPWYAEEKVRKGAFSTVLGLTLEDQDKNGGSGVWKALAVGDSCLVQIRNEMLLSSFPLSSAAEFTNSPFLLGSSPEANTGIDSEVRSMTGDWQSGDRFYLMTDAIAAWFFREVENNQAPWHALGDLDTDELPFRPWLDELRTTHQMRNDDVTLYRIELD
jgi:hypothetical protein